LRTLNARGLASRGYIVIAAGKGFEVLAELDKQGGPRPLLKVMRKLIDDRPLTPSETQSLWNPTPETNRGPKQRPA
jgi:hypothetical protein